MAKQHCQLCGGAFLEGKEQPWVCSKCNHSYFENPIITVDSALFNSKGEVLITQRGMEPWKGTYDLTGGFAEPDESLEDCFAREITEELGINSEDYEDIVYVSSYPHDYPYEGEVKKLIIPVFAARLKTDTVSITLDKKEVSSYSFVRLDELDSIEFSNPKYPDIIRLAHDTLSKENGL